MNHFNETINKINILLNKKNVSIHDYRKELSHIHNLFSIISINTSLDLYKEVLSISNQEYDLKSDYINALKKIKTILKQEKIQ